MFHVIVTYRTGGYRTLFERFRTYLEACEYAYEFKSRHPNVDTWRVI